MKFKSIIFFGVILFGFFSAKNLFAANLKQFTNYQQHEEIKECDILQKDWEQCLVRPCSSESSMNEREAKLCYMQIAVKNNDPSICSTYSAKLGFAWQSQCLTEMSVVETEYSMSICDEINNINFETNPSIVQISPMDKPQDFYKNSCFYNNAINTGNIPACNKIREIDTDFLKDCHIKSLDKGWMYVSKEPNLCKTFPADNQKKCYEVALSGLRRSEMEEYVTINFDSICEKFPDYADKDKCYETSLEAISSFDNLKFITDDVSVCQRFPKKYHENCYDNALENSLKLKLGNKICNNFPVIGINKTDLSSDLVNAFSFNSRIRQGHATKEKCYIEAGLNLKNISENDDEFLNRNIIALSVILILAFLNTLIFIIGIKKLNNGFLYLMIIFPLIYVIIFCFTDLKNIMNDVFFFYISLVYLGCISSIEAIAFFLIYRKRGGILFINYEFIMSKAKIILVYMVFLILSAILFFIGWKIYEFKRDNVNIKNTTIQKTSQSPEEAQILECNKINDESDRELCYLGIGLDSSNTSGYFDTIDSCANYMEGLTKSLCYSGFAVKQNDLSLCQKISTEEYVNTCQDLYYGKLSTLGKGDAKQCENISEKNEAIRCIRELAIKNQDYTICDSPGDYFWPKIDDYSEKYECYTKVAEKKNDKTICDKIPEANHRDWCYDKID